jgi:hypothetical protein
MSSPKSPLAPLADYVSELRLPKNFDSRERSVASDAVKEVLRLRTKHSRRRYLTGLLMAFVAMAEDLLQAVGADSVPDGLTRFPALSEHGGKTLNTLTIRNPANSSSVVSLRGYYNSVESAIRHSLRRPDYPNMAPHATQAWAQHTTEFELILSMAPSERAELVDALWGMVLDIPETRSMQAAIRSVRPFETLLLGFDGGQKGEPPGAVLQGLAYAYYRADTPTVTLRVHKSGAGSKTVGAIGDVDGWVGDTLGLTVEVKDHDLTDSNIDLLASFFGECTHWPDATAIVLARSFTDSVRNELAARQILALDRERMASNVAFWDVPKQQLALREFLHFVAVVQANSLLLERFQEWCRKMSLNPRQDVAGAPD